MKIYYPFTILLLLWISLIVPVSAQDPVSKSPENPIVSLSMAQEYLSEARNLYQYGNFKQAADLAGQALEYLREIPLCPERAEAAFQTGRALNRLDSVEAAQFLLTEAVMLWRDIAPLGSKAEGSVWLELGTTLLHEGEYDEVIETAQMVLDMYDALMLENQPDQAAANRMIGKATSDKGFYLEAMPYFEKALQITRVCTGESSLAYADILGEQGKTYLYSGAYDKAILTLEQALAIQQKILPANHPDIAGICQSLGNCQKTLKKYDNAIQYYQKVLEIRLGSVGVNSGLTAYCYSDIGDLYLSKKEYPKALEYFQKGNEIMIAIGEDKHPDYSYTCNDLGRVHYALGNYPESIIWQKKALALLRSISTVDNMDIATVIRYIGRAQLANLDFEGAIKSFDEDHKILSNLFGPDSELLQYSNTARADTYKASYKASGADSLLQKSRSYYCLSQKSIELQLQKESSADTQKKVLYDAVPIFERAIAAEILSLKSGSLDPEAVANAWQLSESMHSYLLFATTREANARHFAGIPDAQLVKDSLIRNSITTLEREKQSMLAEQGLHLTDSAILAINARIYAKKAELLELSSYFEKQFPDYYRLKFDLGTTSLQKAREMLSPQQTLLEYFSGDSSIFVFVLHRNDSRVFELPRDFPLSTWVKNLREGISGYYGSHDRKQGLYENTVKQYIEYARKLHLKLVAPLESFLTPELIIIPSNELANIPFEALLGGAPKDPSNFKTYPFLLRRYTIHYAYSATMLQQMQERKHRQTGAGGILAFAPFFEQDSSQLSIADGGDLRSGLSPLPFSGAEVLTLKKRFGATSQILLGKSAIKSQFLAQSGGFQILHLATHGKANHLAGDFSYLAFAGDKTHPENGLLSVGELYNCALNADLVVLSACETGIGEDQRGEGVVSLSRAFAFAGAKSIVSSLWSVNDKSTSQVMDDFYAELLSGKTKNIALATAKLHYLDRHASLEAHPFFWAGFVAVGDMAAIKP